MPDPDLTLAVGLLKDVLDRYACRPAGDRLEVAFSRRLPEGRVEELALTLARAEG